MVVAEVTAREAARPVVAASAVAREAVREVARVREAVRVWEAGQVR
ncbi:hypothetical protein [Amycolatopsis sulphurea]|nr:hypothetical protein [Amycolatopsis sulphurea]